MHKSTLFLALLFFACTSIAQFTTPQLLSSSGADTWVAKDALGRSLLLSDEPLLADMRNNLSMRGYKFDTLVERIVVSRQFLTKRTTPSS